MTIGRIFPIKNPSRSFPFDPETHGENDRNAPLPFQLGAGASVTIETIYEITLFLQTSVSTGGEPGPGPGPGPGDGAGGIICNPVSNQFCVPTGTITKASTPVGTIRCAIT